jgi:hypothetical protein
MFAAMLRVGRIQGVSVDMFTRRAAAMATAMILVTSAQAAQAQTRYFARQHLHMDRTPTSPTTPTDPDEKPAAQETMPALVCNSMQQGTEFTYGGWADFGRYTADPARAVDLCINYQHQSGRKDIIGCQVVRNKNVDDYTVHAVVSGTMVGSTRGFGNAAATTCSMGTAVKGSVPIVERPEPARAVCGPLGNKQVYPVTETTNASDIGYADTIAEAREMCNRRSTTSTRICMAFRTAGRGGQYTVWISGDTLKTADPYYESHVAACS